MSSLKDSEWLTAAPYHRRTDPGSPQTGSIVDVGYRNNHPDRFHSRSYITDTKTGAVANDYNADTNIHSGHEYKFGFRHTAWNHRHRWNQLHDIGGDFTKYDISVQGGAQEWNAWDDSGSLRNVLQTRVCSASPVVDLMIGGQDPLLSNNLSWISGKCPVQLSQSELDAKGTTAIARCAPTTPAADLSTAIGELVHDGLPSLPGRGEGAGNVGAEYLNMQFAWSPTISDGLSFLRAIRDQDHILAQFVRDSGRVIRRRYGFPRETTSTTTTTAGVYPGSFNAVPASSVFVQAGTLVTNTVTTRDVWFSGAFTYLIPQNALGRTVAELDKVYGIAPGPSTLWNLTPWSWLVDWFSNAGDVMRNLDAFITQGLVMPYGYVMSDITETTTRTWSGGIKNGTVYVPRTVQDVVVKRSRVRRQANPFGFGVHWDGLSVFQTSILAALGISRGQGAHQ